MVPIEVVPSTNCSIQVHDENRVPPSILRESALLRQVQPGAPHELRIALLVSSRGEQIPAFSGQSIRSFVLDVLVAKAVIVSGDLEADSQLLDSLWRIAGNIAVVSDCWCGRSRTAESMLMSLCLLHVRSLRALPVSLGRRYVALGLPMLLLI